MVAAYAASVSLRAAKAFSACPSLSQRTVGQVPRLPLAPPIALNQREVAPAFVMSASASTEADSAVDIASNIGSVRQRMEDAMAANERPLGSVRLVAVSKTKPLELLQAAYEVRE